MNLILCDINPKITDAWKDCFAPNEARIITSDFRNLPKYFPDTPLFMCTAGNAFGIMGGGLDLVVAQHFKGIEEAVQSFIGNVFLGEIPIGNAASVPLTDDYYPFVQVVYIPTMYTPTRLSNGKNVYWAMRAALTYQHMFLQSIPIMEPYAALVIPGFGGQCGGLSPRTIAENMKYAYDSTKRHMPTTHTQMIERYQETKTVFNIR